MNTESAILENSLPSISVVMPIFNESEIIEKSLNSILSQNYPGKIEVICVDGMSNDGTRDILKSIADKNKRVKIFNNPEHIIPSALNIGVKNSAYEFIARMDGHSIAPDDYLRKCMELMLKTDVDCTGGRFEYRGTAYLSKAIGAAMDSQFGTGTAIWRGNKSSGYTDTVPYGLYKRDRILQLGGFNEKLLCNEDYEFNYRLRMGGGRILYSPDISVNYYSRQNPLSLWKQYFRYGFWKGCVAQMHPKSLMFRQFIAPLFVCGIIFGAVLSIFGKTFFILYSAGLIAYILLSILFSMKQAKKFGWQYLPVIPPVFAVLHTAWGLGFLSGIVKWFIFKEDKREK